MSKGKKSNGNGGDDADKPRSDYEVGYGKPPRHSRFVPGQSGNRGRKKKSSGENPARMIARLRDEAVTVHGRTMTKFELAVTSTINQTIKSGKPRDLEVLLNLLEKHGAMPQADIAAEQRAAGEETRQRIGQIMERTLNMDPKDVALIHDHDVIEERLIMGCERCGTELRRRWAEPAYKALVKRHHETRMHGQVLYGGRMRDLRTYKPGVIGVQGDLKSEEE